MEYGKNADLLPDISTPTEESIKGAVNCNRYIFFMPRHHLKIYKNSFP